MKSISKEMYIKNILEWASICSVVIILILRIYSAYIAQPVVTHDDRHYRGIAMYFEPRVTFKGAVKDVFLPNSSRLGNRTIGYNSALVLGLKLFKGLNTERIFQTINLIFYLIQLLGIMYIAKWAVNKIWFIFSATFLYASIPIIFGMSRWIYTENFVMPALIVYTCAGLFLLKENTCGDIEKRGKGKYFFSEILAPFVVAWVIGMFGSCREYAVPYLLVVIAAIIFGMILKKRWIALIFFTGALTPFVVSNYQSISQFIRYSFVTKTGITSTVTMVGDKVEVVKAGASKISHLKHYYKPFYVWMRETIPRSMGIAATIFIACSSAYFFKIIASQFIVRIKEHKNLSIFQINGYNIILSAQLCLAVFYWAAIMVINVRLLRAGIMPIIASFIFATMCFKTILQSNKTSKVVIKSFFLALIVISWVVCFYQLFVAFDGGKSFAVKPYEMVTYNHPLNLRKLKFFGDWHVVPLEDKERIK